MKVGDRVIDDLTGEICTVINFGSRDNLEPLPGVVLLGNAVILEDKTGKKFMTYEWDVSEIK